MKAGMSTVYITEAELARDLHDVLAKVQLGVEVVIEQDHRPVAVLRSPLPTGRSLADVSAALAARASLATMDEDFARDIESGIQAQREPWTPPSWE